MIESGQNARCISFGSAMTGACGKRAALMKRPENNFRLRGRRKFNLSNLGGLSENCWSGLVSHTYLSDIFKQEEITKRVMPKVHQLCRE